MIFRFIESKPAHSARIGHVARWADVSRTWGLELSAEAAGYYLTLLRNDDFCVDPLWGDDACRQLFDAGDRVVTYNLGEDRLAVILSPRLLMNMLRGVGENASGRHVGLMLPEQRYTPMRDDAGCWRRLCVYAGETDLAELCLRAGGKLALPDPDNAPAHGKQLHAIFSMSREVA